MDDEPDILAGYAELIESSVPGSVVLTASSAKTALAILRRERVHLIISDYRMPKMDGLQFLAVARREYPDVPRILFTANLDRDLQQLASAKGAAIEFLSKMTAPPLVTEIVRIRLAARVDAPARGGRARYGEGPGTIQPPGPSKPRRIWKKPEPLSAL